MAKIFKLFLLAYGSDSNGSALDSSKIALFPVSDNDDSQMKNANEKWKSDNSQLHTLEQSYKTYSDVSQDKAF